MTRWLLTGLVTAVVAATLAHTMPRAVSGPSPAASADAGADAGRDAARPTGRHWRVRTGNGPVHVWMPEGYEPASAGTVVYVHGYYSNVDQAWRDHRLAAQFAASGRNALFIVPEAPVRHRHEVRWRDLGALIRAVRQQLGLARPWGPVVAIGHSGAYRTLIPWLDYPPLERVILLDGLYGHQQHFAEWLEEPRAEPNRLTLVGIDTLRWSEPWARRLGQAHTLDWVPDRAAELDPRALAARLLYIRSQYGHMDIVKAGRVIPVVLQATRLPALPGHAP